MDKGSSTLMQEKVTLELEASIVQMYSDGMLNSETEAYNSAALDLLRDVEELIIQGMNDIKKI